MDIVAADDCRYKFHNRYCDSRRYHPASPPHNEPHSSARRVPVALSDTPYSRYLIEFLIDESPCV
ncbi:hypothetical protein E2C01_037476 [Portunus trituberculatus]|uniref:Uncharacterized protein n=1 Tax=Portunus trituberculatus TaxID=210409 RepID=A0A5B7FBI5_PORTR|nr:hypothetical protein [Portunus trituberculatus]